MNIMSACLPPPPPSLHSPLEEGAGVTCRGKPREIPDQNGYCQGPKGHHLKGKIIFKKRLFWFEGLAGIEATSEGFMNPAGKWVEKLCASSSPHLLAST